MLLKKNQLLNCYKSSSSSSMIVVQRKVGNQVRSSKNCRKLSNFGFINCLVGPFLFVFLRNERDEREPISVKSSEMMSSKGHNSCLPCQAKKKTKLYGDRENKWNCNEIDQESVLFSFNYCTHIHQFTFELFLISVLVGLKYKTKRKRKRTMFDFGFYLIYFTFSHSNFCSIC